MKETQQDLIQKKSNFLPESCVYILPTFQFTNSLIVIQEWLNKTFIIEAYSNFYV